jgi:outer membrane protein assembly factor BamB
VTECACDIFRASCPFLGLLCVVSVELRMLVDTTAMNCTDVERQIELYVLGGADEVEARQIEQHLRGCPNCRLLQQECETILLELKAHGRGPSHHQANIGGMRPAVGFSLRNAGTRRRFRIAASIAAALVLAATVWHVWPDNDESPAQSSSKAVLAPSKTLWQKAATVAMGATEADDIVIRDGTVYLLADSGAGQAVSAVETDSGKTLWQSEQGSCGYLAADDERVYCVALADQAKLHLLALDRKNGRPVWTFGTPQTTSALYGTSKPTVMPGRRVCWVQEDSAYAIDARTGKQIWSRTFPKERNLSQAAAIGRKVYVAGRNGIYCLDGADGEVRWCIEEHSDSWFATKPLTAVGRDGLFVVTATRTGKSLVQCINTSTRRFLWQKTVPRVSHVFADSANVYLRCQQVLAMDQADGERLWTIEATGCSPITACADTVCFIDSAREGSLVAARCYNGEVVWKVPGLHSCNAFVKVGQHGYLKTNDNVVLAFAFDS